MTAFTLVSNLGEIISIVNAPNNEQLAVNIPVWATAIEGQPADWQCYYAAGAWVPKGAQPSLFCVWDAVTKTWIDPRTLAQLKSAKWEQIKAARSAAIDAPLTTPYGAFDSYAEARSNITDAVLLAQTLAGMGQPVAIAYTLADNQVVTLDLTGMVTVGLMLGSKVQTVRGIATALRTQIEAATTSTQLDAIQWPT